MPKSSNRPVRSANRFNRPAFPKWLPWAAAAALVVGAIGIVYGRAINAPFIFDDTFSVLDNSSITRLWPLEGDPERPGPFNPPVDIPTSGRPLVNLSLALNYHFGRLDPAGYHVFNMVVHALAALLLMSIINRILRLNYFAGKFERTAGWLSLGIALLWALHPLQTETVVYVTQRTELLVGFFYLATLYCSLRYWAAGASAPRSIWLTLATLACLCGMACKEVMVTAPVIVLLVDRMFVAGSFREALRKSWPLYFALAASWVLLIILNRTAPRADSAGFNLGVPAVQWWLTQTKVFWIYLKLAFWPWPLAIHYEMPYLSTFAAAWPWVLASAAVLVAICVLLQRRNPIGFVGAWVLLILSPTLVVPILTEVAAERRMYLPLAAMAALVVIGGYRLAQLAAHRAATGADKRAAVPYWPVGIFAAAILVLAAVAGTVSAQRLAVYRDPIALWQDLLITSPNDVRAHNNLAVALNNANRLPEALAQCEEALRLNPNSSDAQTNFAIALASTGHIQAAIEHFEKAIEIQPNHMLAHYDLAIALASSGRLPEAIEHYRQAVRLKPDYAAARYNLGNAFLNSGQLQQAIEQYEQVLQIDSNYPNAQGNWGAALLRLGRTPEAIQHLQLALRRNPDDAEAQTNLGTALMTTNRISEAIEHYRHAVQLQPELANARSNLGTALFQSGRQQEGIEQIEQALKLNPNLVDGYRNLAIAYGQANQSEKAIATAERGLDVARAQGQTAAAQQIESWLSGYRAQQKANSKSGAGSEASRTIP